MSFLSEINFEDMGMSCKYALTYSENKLVCATSSPWHQGAELTLSSSDFRTGPQPWCFPVEHQQLYRTFT